jgi:pSer/pThr/pTyr-binding forkhead associated (FHA) protein
MKARVRVVDGRLAGQTVEIGTRLLVGRETDCDLRPVGEFVSRHHCALAFDGFTLRILDLGSKNGTFVNGHRIAAGE